MNPLKNGPAPLRRSIELECERLCETHAEMLRVLLRQLGVPAEAIHPLLQEVFLAYYCHDRPPRDAEAWLIAAAGDHANAYLRRHGLAAGDLAVARRETQEIVRHRAAL